MSPSSLAKLGRSVGAGVLAFVVTSSTAYAHVKWFADFTFADEPLSVGQVLTPTLIALIALTSVVLGALVWVEPRLHGLGLYRGIEKALEARRHRALDVMRIGVGVTMLLNWQADALLVPELSIGSEWLGWFQFAIALLLLDRRTTPFAGGGLILLYAAGIYQFGFFHMLDYPYYAGAGYFLIVAGSKNEKLAGTALPALYLTVGFSLCWVALEKLVYPGWGLYILEQNPQLTLGLDMGFFLKAAAMVEFGLGFILIIGLLERPIALVITLVFFTTTLVFGKLEVIGHTALHAALIVFLLEGVGRTYRPPYTFHEKMPLRVAFGAVNVVVLFFLLLVPYTWAARSLYEHVQTHGHQTTQEAEEAVERPPVQLVP
jgi:hypothetical protein